MCQPSSTPAEVAVPPPPMPEDEDDNDSLLPWSPPLCKRSNKMAQEPPPITSQSTRVRFSRKIYVRTTLHYKDYHHEEHAACWYSPKESLRIRRINLKAVELMEHGSIPPQRGLEVHVESAHKARQHAKMRVRQAVLKEQDCDEADDMAVARASMQESLESRMSAMVTGMSDALWLAKNLLACQRKHGLSSSNNHNLPSYAKPSWVLPTKQQLSKAEVCSEPTKSTNRRTRSPATQAISQSRLSTTVTSTNRVC